MVLHARVGLLCTRAPLPAAHAMTTATRFVPTVRVLRNGGPEVLELRNLLQFPVPLGSVRVAVKSVGVNFHDTYTRTGLYKTPMPFTGGCEGTGVVTEAKGDSAGLRAGDRVAFFHYNSAYATETVVPGAACFRLPDAVSFELGAAALVQGLTVVPCHPCPC